MKPIKIIAFFILPLFILTILFAGQAETTEFSKNVAPSAEQICPLLVGSKIPQLELKTSEGQPFDLNQSISQKPALLIFYRGGWCPYCNSHLAELQKIETDLLEMGYQIIAISVDRFENLPATLEKHQLKYTLLSDNQAQATRAFGLAYKVSDATFRRLHQFGMNLEKASGEEHHILPVPAAFLIGTDGVIKFSYVNPNYKLRIKANLVLAAARVELP